MTGWFERRNQKVIEALPPERLLVYSPRQGWEPLCSFLGVRVPDEPFPRINSRDESSQKSRENGGIPADPEAGEKFAKGLHRTAQSQGFRQQYSVKEHIAAVA